MGCGGTKGATVAPAPASSGSSGNNSSPKSSEDMSNNNLTVSQPSGATGNPRNKVILGPGRSLVDWLKLSSPPNNLKGTGAPESSVITAEELAKHNKKDDAWIAIRGKVYNITPYLSFHPGGADELMKGAGKEATNLFTEVHPWVNVESMLKAVFLGTLKSEAFSRPSSSKRTSTPSRLAVPTLAVPAQQKIRSDWYQSDGTATVCFYPNGRKLTLQNAIIDLNQRMLRIAICLNERRHIYHMELFEDVEVDYQVQLSESAGKIEVTLKKTKTGQWGSIGTPKEDHEKVVPYVSEDLFYRKCTLASRTRVTHNTELFCLKLPTASRMWIPIGHHIRLQRVVHGMDVGRFYTPVLSSLEGDDKEQTNGRCIYLMIKCYDNGTLTPTLKNDFKIGDSIDVSDYFGTFDQAQLDSRDYLLLIAAGTGFTPMVKLIYLALFERQMKVDMFFFNREEKDILWQSELERLEKKFPERFRVIHILSEPAADWRGMQGRPTQESLSEILPHISPGNFACVCGPPKFNELVENIFPKLGFRLEDVQAFS